MTLQNCISGVTDPIENHTSMILPLLRLSYPYEQIVLLKLIPDSVLLSLLWCHYMVVNVSVQYNGGFPPDIILLTLRDYIGEPF